MVFVWDKIASVSSRSTIILKTWCTKLKWEAGFVQGEKEVCNRLFITTALNGGLYKAGSFLGYWIMWIRLHFLYIHLFR